MKKLTYLFLMTTALMLVAAPVSFAQDAPDAGAMPQGFEPYDGEITDEIIEKFLNADYEIQMMRREVAIKTQEILQDKDLAPEIYIAVVQKMRTDTEFLKKLQARAQEKFDIQDQVPVEE